MELKSISTYQSCSMGNTEYWVNLQHILSERQATASEHAAHMLCGNSDAALLLLWRDINANTAS